MIKLIKSSFYKEVETKNKLKKFIEKAEQLSFGNECKKFEVNFAKYQGRKFCVFVNSGSSANLALVQAILNLGKIKKGDYVGVSGLTWSTNVMPFIELGLKPVPIDIELDTLNVSSERLLDILKKFKIKVLLLTNLLGFCDDIDKIKEVCEQKGIILLEDNCESLGTVYKGKKLGNFGLASTFSFYVGHHISTIEGGAICTDNRELATMLSIVRAHGWDRNLTGDVKKKLRNKYKVNFPFYSRYTFYDLGYNLRPTEISGFIGNIQLGYIEEIIKKRRDNFYKIADVLYKNSKKYYKIKYDHIDFLSNFAIPIICRTRKIRDELVVKCNGKIEIRPVVGGSVMEQPFFRRYMKKIKIDNPNAALVHRRGLYFGNNPELTKIEINKILKVFVEED